MTFEGPSCFKNPSRKKRLTVKVCVVCGQLDIQNVYMYVHALTPPACGLSFICNKVLFCSVLFCSEESWFISGAVFYVVFPKVIILPYV